MTMGIDIRGLRERPLKDEEGYVGFDYGDHDTITGYAPHRVDTDAVWYHGTSQLEPFAEGYRSGDVQEGTSFTRSFDTAERYSYKPGGAFSSERERAEYERGEYDDGYGDEDSDEDDDLLPGAANVLQPIDNGYGEEPQFENSERGRVISNIAKIPPTNGEPIILRFEPDIGTWDSYMDEGDEIGFYEQLHEEAARITREHGYPAYTIEHIGGLDEMVVLDPNKYMRVIEQDVQGEASVIPSDHPAVDPMALREHMRQRNMAKVSEAIADYVGTNDPVSVGGNAWESAVRSAKLMEYRGMPREPAYRARRGRGSMRY